MIPAHCFPSFIPPPHALRHTTVRLVATNHAPHNTTIAETLLVQLSLCFLFIWLKCLSAIILVLPKCTVKVLPWMTEKFLGFFSRPPVSSATPAPSHLAVRSACDVARRACLADAFGSARRSKRAHCTSCPRPNFSTVLPWYNNIMTTIYCRYVVFPAT